MKIVGVVLDTGWEAEMRKGTETDLLEEAIYRMNVIIQVCR